VDFAFEKLDRDLDFVMTCLREVLDEVGASAAASRLPWIAGGPDARAPIEERDVQALSISFQLLNLVEENAAAQSRRLEESTGGVAVE
ncbi:hypothetical protein ACSTKG_00175, partial [Vibrio parahaemolyticus]